MPKIRYVICQEKRIEKITVKMLYVIWVETGKEEELKKQIETVADAKTFLCCRLFYREEYRKIKGIWKAVTRVLFPGYLFIEAEDIEAVFWELKHIPGLTKILKTGDAFTPISLQEEALVRRLTGENGIAGVSVGMIEGDKVKVDDGPLLGLEGYIRKIDRHKRKAYLEVELLGRKMEIGMGLEIVRKVADIV